MRNYISVFAMSWDQIDPDDGVTIIGTLNRFFNDEDEARNFAAGLGSGFNLQDGAGWRWLLLDKATMIFALNSQAPFSNSANLQFVSPRQPAALPGWPNNDGNPDGPTYNQHLGDEKHFQSKTGDFSGANGLIDWLNGLALYATQLRAAGRVRDAGIVQFAYDQVKKGLWTITEAAQYLKDNGLV